jgi:hypothetical protein
MRNRTNILLAPVLALLAGGLLGGCSVEDTPHAPTFATDIKPIMLSRCVRCHGAGGHLNQDQHTTAMLSAPFDGFFDRMEDDCPDGQASGCHGLGHYTTGALKTRLLNLIHGGKGDVGPMPPLPAPALTAHQIEIVELWLTNGAPAE